MSVASGGGVTGMSPGTSTISCVAQNVPEYVAQFCGSNCRMAVKVVRHRERQQTSASVR